MLRDWLASYQPETCFDSAADASQVIRPEVLKILPAPSKRLGQSPYAHQSAFALDLPQKWTDLGKAVGDKVSPMKGIGRYLDEVIKRNQKTFRIFSPDEVRLLRRSSFLGCGSTSFVAASFKQTRQRVGADNSKHAVGPRDCPQRRACH